MRFRHIAVLATCLACGCATQPYVQFEAEHGLALHGLFPATVTGIDGLPVNAGSTPAVAPGVRVLRVEMRLAHDAAPPIPKTLRVEAQPCMRYYIASRYVGGGLFEPVVSASEAIGECRA